MNRIDEHCALSAGYDGSLRWIDVSGEAEQRKIQLHNFWSWDMALSPNKQLIASVTGQYLAGGYKYEPRRETEPSIRIVATETGEILHSLPHVPSVQAVAFSPDNRYVAAGNLMGEIRVFDVNDGEMVANWTTSSFTSWGVIKSHCYLGGIFAMQFTPDGNHLLLAGMGPMRDPMAGNGKQRWEKWKWNDFEPSKIDETHRGDSGEGLMETPCHPSIGRILRDGWQAAWWQVECRDV